jgi:hypothetical protein
VQRKFRKRTTLRSKSSTLKGLLYAPIQQKQSHKRTTLRRLKIPLQSIVARKVRTIAFEQSAKKAVMRHAINAIYGMGTLKILLQSIRSKESPHYCLGAKREEAVRRQATINLYSQVWISFGDSIPRLYCVAWLTQESVSSRIFVRKKGMNCVQSSGRSQQTPSAKFGKEKTCL